MTTVPAVTGTPWRRASATSRAEAGTPAKSGSFATRPRVSAAASVAAVRWKFEPTSTNVPMAEAKIATPPTVRIGWAPMLVMMTGTRNEPAA